MTQNGPYPDQPSQHPGQPWPADGPAEPYRPPADPWGEHSDGWGAAPMSTPPEAGGSPADYGLTGSGYVPGQAYPAVAMPPGAELTGMQPPGYHPTGPASGPPAATTGPVWTQAPPRKRGPGALIVSLVAVLGLLICGGLAAIGWLLTHQKAAPATAQPTAAPTRSTAATAADPRPQTSQEARFVAKGECVRNEGTSDVPKMTIVGCASGTYEVLARINGRTTGEADAKSKCAKVRQYTKWYFYDSELDELDFVLCLKER